MHIDCVSSSETQQETIIRVLRTSFKRKWKEYSETNGSSRYNCASTKSGNILLSVGCFPSGRVRFVPSNR